MTATLPIATRILAAPFALIAPVDAVVASAADMSGEAKFWLLVAVIATALVACMTPIIRRQRRAQEAEDRRRMAEYRGQWFASFERRQRMKGARP